MSTLVYHNHHHSGHIHVSLVTSTAVNIRSDHTCISVISKRLIVFATYTVQIYCFLFSS